MKPSTETEERGKKRRLPWLQALALWLRDRLNRFVREDANEAARLTDAPSEADASGASLPDVAEDRQLAGTQDGPPEHWLTLVREHAPHLLMSSGDRGLVRGKTARVEGALRSQRRTARESQGINVPAKAKLTTTPRRSQPQNVSGPAVVSGVTPDPNALVSRPVAPGRPQPSNTSASAVAAENRRDERVAAASPSHLIETPALSHGATEHTRSPRLDGSSYQPNSGKWLQGESNQIQTSASQAPSANQLRSGPSDPGLRSKEQGTNRRSVIRPTDQLVGALPDVPSPSVHSSVSSIGQAPSTQTWPELAFEPPQTRPQFRRSASKSTRTEWPELSFSAPVNSPDLASNDRTVQPPAVQIATPLEDFGSIRRPETMWQQNAASHTVLPNYPEPEEDLWPELPEEFPYWTQAQTQSVDDRERILSLDAEQSGGN